MEKNSKDWVNYKIKLIDEMKRILDDTKSNLCCLKLGICKVKDFNEKMYQKSSAMEDLWEEFKE